MNSLVVVDNLNTDCYTSNQFFPFVSTFGPGMCYTNEYISVYMWALIDCVFCWNLCLATLNGHDIHDIHCNTTLLKKKKKNKNIIHYP